jgi:hypothetical protein
VQQLPRHRVHVQPRQGLQRHLRLGAWGEGIKERTGAVAYVCAC